jgi:large subunit ribosomal protein L9
VKVVFLEDVVGTARIGDIKDVKPGFARNYLLPRRLAAPATPSIVKSAEARAKREMRLQEARDNDAKVIAERLEAASFSFNARAGASGKLFGSVGTADIAGRVGEMTGGEFDRHHVLLQEPIKELGDYQVPLRLTRNVSATINVSVIGEDGTTAADIRARADAAAKTEDAEASDAGETAADGVDEDDMDEDGAE